VKSWCENGPVGGRKNLGCGGPKRRSKSGEKATNTVGQKVWGTVIATALGAGTAGITCQKIKLLIKKLKKNSGGESKIFLASLGLFHCGGRKKFLAGGG